MKIFNLTLGVLFTFLISLPSLSETTAVKVPPLEKVNEEFNFQDDLHFEHMLKAIVRQEKYFARRDANTSMNFGGKRIKRSHLHKSLLVFKKHVTTALNCFELHSAQTCYTEFNEKMNREFDAYRPIPAKWEKGYAEKKTMFTAYYSPDLHGSKVKTEIYKNPIYALPKDPKLAKATSDEINYGGVLKGKGLELVYVKESLYDIWLLHVEGGGRVIVENEDGTKEHLYLSYKASNGQAFNMLYKYMISEGMLPKGGATIAKQREYFEKHPEDRRRILKTCPSYIFFQITKSEPLGVHNIPLTENRSLATDYRRMTEYGVINFIKTKKPVFSEDGSVKKVDFSRFFLNQDTGGAIKGNARVDLYFGYGDSAELAANYVYGLGEQYYLILK